MPLYPAARDTRRCGVASGAMNHRATILAVLLPIAFFVGVHRYPHLVMEAGNALRAALAWAS